MRKKGTTSQNAQLLKHLLGGGTTTSLDALKRFGCLRLAARVYDLRNRGHQIRSNPVVVTNLDGEQSTVHEYYLPVAGVTHDHSHG